MEPLLADEVRRKLVKVEDRRDRTVITILGDGLFKPGDAAVSAADQPLIARIADALAGVPGQVEVTGHTDNTPIRTLRFPSNWELSKARAESVGRALAARLGSGRVRAEGRGDSEPLESNDSPQGRARNRRVEITLYAVPGDAPAAAPGVPAGK